MTVARLNAYRKRLLELEALREPSDLSDAESAAMDPDRIYFKDDPRWAPLLATVLRILGTAS